MRVDISSERDGTVAITVTSKGYNPDTLDDIINRAMRVVLTLQHRQDESVKKHGGA